MSGASHFAYKPVSDREIRLLSWNSGHSKPDLIHVSIDRPPKYDALSYCWGVEYCLQNFQLRCGETAITSSLWRALCQYRQTPSTGMLWADALCINQKDAAEKTQQVRLMAEIFARAESVLVSMGELTSDARCAIALVPFVMQKLLSTSDVASVDLGRSSQWYDSDPFPLFWRGIAQINHHPWFRRVWTLQEAVLARRLRFIGDGILIGFEALLSLFNCLYEKKLIGRLYYGPFQNSTGLTGMVQINQFRYGTRQGLPTYDLILALEQRESLRAEDYVYGLLGILDRRIVSAIPTAEVSVSSLYSQATLSIIRAESSVNILKLVSNEQGMDWPSWCVNFADKNRPVDFNRGSFHAGLGFADLLHQAETCPQFDGDALMVSGKVFDKITAVVGPYEREMHMSHDAIMLWNLACRRIVTDRHQIPNNFLSLHAEAICGGYLPGPDRLYSPDDIQAYRAMMTTVPQSRDEYVQLWDRNMDYVISVYEHTKNRAFFVTQNGHVGLGPPRTEIGDVVSVLVTGEVPFILHQMTESQPSYQLVGPAYVPGVMFGEAIVDQSIGFQKVRLV